MTIRRMQFVDETEFRDVLAAGAIGNFLGYYIDDEAAILRRGLLTGIVTDQKTARALLK